MPLVENSKRAKKNISKLPEKHQEQIKKKIKELELNPKPSGVKPFYGRANTFYLHSGLYRIDYEMTPALIEVINVDRKNDDLAYRPLLRNE